MTLTRPLIPTNHNGPGIDKPPDTEIDNYDIYGRILAHGDADSFVTTWDYDQGTGAVKKIVQDSGGLNLTTLIDVDPLGRPLKRTDPVSTHITYFVYDDVKKSVRTYLGWRQDPLDQKWKPTGPTQVVREVRPAAGTGNALTDFPHDL